MKYNTEEKKLVMPEYGRNIQNMVDYCITIQDREERKRCARHNNQHHGKHVSPFTRCKRLQTYSLGSLGYYGRLQIGYRLSVRDRKERRPYTARPPRIPYNNNSRIRYRHYGKTLEN